MGETADPQCGGHFSAIGPASLPNESSVFLQLTHTHKQTPSSFLLVLLDKACVTITARHWAVCFSQIFFDYLLQVVESRLTASFFLAGLWYGLHVKTIVWSFEGMRSLFDRWGCVFVLLSDTLACMRYRIDRLHTRIQNGSIQSGSVSLCSLKESSGKEHQNHAAVNKKSASAFASSIHLANTCIF